MKTGKIYIVTNTVNGKYYVGKTTRTRAIRRFYEHQKPHRPTILSCAIQKYGVENFSFAVVAETEDLTSLDSLEKLWIAVLSANRRGVGYNITDGGANYTRTASVRAAQSQKMRGKRTGWHHTEEARQRMSEACKGRKASPETVEKIRLAQIGRTPWNKGTRGAQAAWNKGIPMTSAMREHQSNIRKGGTMAPEVKAKISFALKGRMPAVNAMGLAPWNKGVKGGQVSWNKGKPLSPEHRANLSKSKKGRTVSAEHREKLSVASRKRWGLPAKAA